MDATGDYLLLLGLSVAAHMAVAYLLAPWAAERRLEGYLSENPNFSLHVSRRVGPALETYAETTEGQAFLDRLTDRLTAKLTGALPAPPEFPEISIPVGEIGDAVTERLTHFFEGQAGKVQRQAQSKGEKLALVNAVFETGNPVFDGLLGMVPPEAKRTVIRRILKVMRQGALDEVDIGPETGLFA